MAVKNVGGRGTVSHRDASRDGGGRSSAHPQPNPDIFYCLLGGVFLLLATATAKPRKPSPPTAQNIAYSVRLSPLSVYPRICIRPFIKYSSWFWVLVFLRLSSSVFRLSFFFRPGFRSLSFRLRLSVFVFVFYRQFILSLKMQNVKLFYFSSNRSILK